ncbi:89e0308f-e4a8-4e6d-b994-b8a1571e84b8 [Thermothielavioides terrestris]|uniref:89e0308f-e4a8-4e6d-b994-b8a1571e84b8 n=1 Tax=Thermothielavioides terrestris TaxID=2587410 RepID=A0A446BF44_9PEZI|nr:89e0308f-e4a8-4e6d-b994-b8a1571e84b8 [Thermothielavioides terrestris]
MVEKDDINSLLQTGSWRTSRSRSPSHYDSQGRVYEAAKPNIRVPRTLEPVSMESLSRTKRPPPPCVEDEEESLAKEYVGSIVSAVSDEEPKSRGEIDQQPILLPVHEHNPERRFVIVPGAAPEDASKTAQARYEANTCRKYVLVTSDNGAEDTESAKEEGAKETSSKQKVDQPKEKPDIPKRKSHQELPRLTTDFEHADAPPIRRSGSRRDRERPLVHQEPQDYNKSRDRSSARPPDSAFLSPAAVKHTSGRRERAYSDARSDASGRSSRSPTTRKAAEVEVFDTRRPPHSSNKYPASPGVHRRASSTTTVPRRDSPPRERIRNGPPPERPKSFLQPYGNGDPDEILAYMAPGRDFTPGRPNRDVSPPRRTPINNSPPHPRGAREMPGPSPNRRRQPRSETRDWDGYSSDEAHRERRPTLAERSYPIRSTLDPDRPTLLSPEQTRRPNPKLEPAGPTILAPLGAQHLFVPAPARWGDRAISCDFGSSPWYRIAYIMTLQHKYQDLRLLQGIASVAAQSQACAGSQLATRIWYSMMAPNSRRPVQTFSVCLGCAKMVEVLLPNLAGVFVPLNSHEPTRGICELHYAPDRKRFFDYFEEMKMTSAAALSRRTAPNLIELVDRIREISLHDECLRNTPIPNRKWHVLQRVPEFTVCEECFNSVVWPMIEDEDNGSDMARNFLKHKQLKPVASCQLYSERMRRVFLEACKYDDYDFLANCVLNRLRVLSEVKARYNELQREDQEDPEVQEELAALARQFKEVDG